MDLICADHSCHIRPDLPAPHVPLYAWSTRDRRDLMTGTTRSQRCNAWSQASRGREQGLWAGLGGGGPRRKDPIRGKFGVKRAILPVEVVPKFNQNPPYCLYSSHDSAAAMHRAVDRSAEPRPHAVGSGMNVGIEPAGESLRKSISSSCHDSSDLIQT